MKSRFSASYPVRNRADSETGRAPDQVGPVGQTRRRLVAGTAGAAAAAWIPSSVLAQAFVYQLGSHHARIQIRKPG